MAIKPQAQIDAEALVTIGTLALETADAIPGLPAQQKSAIVQAVTHVMGEAYMKQRALYFTQQNTPGANVNHGTGL